MRGATVVGRLGGALIAPLPWWASGAPWWAVPIFVIVLGWFCGAVYGGYVFRKVSHVLNAFYPELKL